MLAVNDDDEADCLEKGLFESTAPQSDLQMNLMVSPSGLA